MHTHTHTPQTKISTQRRAHIQLWPHRNAYTELWAEKYMQLFTHRNTFIPLDMEIHTVMDSCKTARRCTKKYIYKGICMKKYIYKRDIHIRI